MERDRSGYDSTVVRSGLKHAVVERMTRHFVPEIEVSNKRNLEQIEEIVAGMHPVIMIANHLSHADAPVLDSAIRRKGFDEIADRLVFMLGIRMTKTFGLNKVLDSYSYIPVWPPTEIPKDSRENAESLGMAKRAIVASRENLKNGRILVIFPEGTRSRNGQLSAVKRVMAHYMLGVDNSYVAPVGISGTEKILPVGNVIPKKGEARVSFGRPIAVDDIKREFADLNKNDRYQLSVDLLMRQVAEQLPEDYQGFYSR